MKATKADRTEAAAMIAAATDNHRPYIAEPCYQRPRTGGVGICLRRVLITKFSPLKIHTDTHGLHARSMDCASRMVELFF